MRRVGRGRKSGIGGDGRLASGHGPYPFSSEVIHARPRTYKQR